MLQKFLICLSSPQYEANLAVLSSEAGEAVNVSDFCSGGPPFVSQLELRIIFLDSQPIIRLQLLPFVSFPIYYRKFIPEFSGIF